MKLSIEQIAKDLARSLNREGIEHYVEHHKRILIEDHQHRSNKIKARKFLKAGLKALELKQGDA